MDIADYLSKDCIVFVNEAQVKANILELLIETAYRAGKIQDKLRFAEAIAARELIVSTGIGLGVAVPHAKLKSIPSFFLVLGILRYGTDWESIDGQPVRIVFLIGGPEKNQKEYLTLLAQIVKTIKNTIVRNKLLDAKNSKEVLELLRN